MGKNTKNKEEGERVFEVYLQENKLPQEYEPPLGPGKRPDYLVHAQVGDVLCEVKDFGEAAIDQRLHEDRQPIRLSDGTTVAGIAVGAWNPLPRIRDRLAKAKKQLGPFKGKYPCVVILYNPGYMADLGDSTVRGAMFGNPAFTFPISMREGEAKRNSHTNCI